MGGAYNDDEATRVDASILKKRRAPEVPCLMPPEDRPSERTQRIRPEEIDRRALPFKKSRDRRTEEPVDDDPLAGLSETGAMRPVQAPVIPFAEPPASHPPPTSVPPPNSHPPPTSVPPPSSHPTPNSNPPSSGRVPTPKFAPRSLPPLEDNPLAQSAWSQHPPALDPTLLPSALAPLSESDAPPAKGGSETAVSRVILVVMALLVVVVVVALSI